MRDDQIIQTINSIRSINSFERLKEFLKTPAAKEGFCHDFKVAIPDSAETKSGRRDEKSLHYRCKCAFASLANCHGGFVILGVDDTTLKPHGCTEEQEIKKRVGDLLSVIGPQPEVVHLPPLKIGRTRRWIYIVEVLPSPSFKKPHIFDGRVFYRTRDASSCHYVKSASELFEKVEFDIFHSGSARSFRAFIQGLRRTAPDLMFPMVRYFHAIDTYLHNCRKGAADSQLVASCIDSFSVMRDSLDNYRTGYRDGNGASSVTVVQLNDHIDQFESSFLKILEMNLNG